MNAINNITISERNLYVVEGDKDAGEYIEELNVLEYEFGVNNKTMYIQSEDMVVNDDIIHIIIAAQVCKMDVNDIIEYAAEVYDMDGWSIGDHTIIF